MPTKHRRFLLVAFILATGALAGSEAAGANLAAGETRLPSGVVVRIDDAASSPEELERKLRETLGATLEEIQRKAFDATDTKALPERISHKLEIVDALHYTISSICDEYIRYLVKPFGTRLAKSIKEYQLDISDRGSPGSKERCVYKVTEGAEITREDGSHLPNIALEKIHLDEINTVSIAFLSEENSLLLPLPLKQILIVVPFPTIDTLDLAPFLTRAAQKLYSESEYRGSIIRFVAASEKNVGQDTYSLPSETVIAFRGVSGMPVFLESLKFMPTKNSSAIAITAWNSNLTEAAAAGRNGESLKNYVSQNLNRDTTKVFDAAGRYAAEFFKSSQVTIAEITVPGSKVKLGLPVLFEFDDGVWRIASKRN
jgi:hypothetical protein